MVYMMYTTSRGLETAGRCLQRHLLYSNLVGLHNLHVWRFVAYRPLRSSLPTFRASKNEKSAITHPGICIFNSGKPGLISLSLSLYDVKVFYSMVYMMYTTSRGLETAGRCLQRHLLYSNLVGLHNLHVWRFVAYRPLRSSLPTFRASKNEKSAITHPGICIFNSGKPGLISLSLSLSTTSKCFVVRCT